MRFSSIYAVVNISGTVAKERLAFNTIALVLLHIFLYSSMYTSIYLDINIYPINIIVM